MGAEYHVYVLRNPKGRYYVGLSEDPRRRLQEHNAGLSQWTKGHRPREIVWQNGPLPLGEARKLENKLKRQGRGHGFYSITGLPKSEGS